MQAYNNGWENLRKFEEKRVASIREVTQTLEYREKMRIALTGRKFSEKSRHKMSVAHKGKPLSSINKQNIANALKGRIISEKCRQATRITWTGRHHTEEAKHKMSISQKRNWQDPQYINKVLTARARARKPNNLECKFIDLLYENNLPFKYNSGEAVIGKFIPDFIAIDGRPLVIELFGSYWHRPIEFYWKKEEYAKLGYRVLILWEDELQDEELLERIVAWLSADESVRHQIQLNRGG